MLSLLCYLFFFLFFSFFLSSVSYLFALVDRWRRCYSRSCGGPSCAIRIWDIWDRRLPRGRASRLRVVVLDTAAAEVVGTAGTGAPGAATAPTAAGTAALLAAAVASDSDAEEQACDEDAGPGSPAEAESVPAETGVAACVLESITGPNECRGHERHGDCEEEEADKGQERGYGGTKATAAGEPGSEPGQGDEEEGHEVEDPAETPHVEVVETRGSAAVRAAQAVRDVGGGAGPSPTEGRGRPGAPAVLVPFIADVEVEPSRCVAGACYAGGVGLEKVDLV